MRDDRVAVDILLEAGAYLEARDRRGRTPVDWAAMKGRGEMVDYLLGKGARKPSVALATPRLRRERETLRTVPVGDGTLERFLDSHGKPVDGGQIEGRQVTLPAPIDHLVSPILETGIKVDLFAPIRRVITLRSVDLSVVLSQSARNLAAEFVSYSFRVRVKPQMQFREWQTMLADDRLLGEHTTCCPSGRHLRDPRSRRDRRRYCGFLSAGGTWRSADHGQPHRLCPWRFALHAYEYINDTASCCYDYSAWPAYHTRTLETLSILSTR